MPELVSLAVRAKAGMEVAKNIKSKEKAYSEANPIVDSMKHWAEVLKAPEEY